VPDVFVILVQLIVVPLLATAGYILFLWRPAGRIRVRRDDYLREPPDDSPPAVVGTLFATTPGTEAMVATLLDLVRRGVVRLDAAAGTAGFRLLSRDDTELTLHRAAAAVLPFEDRLLGAVFLQERDRVSVGDLRDWWRTHGGETERWYESWCASVTEESVGRGLLRGDPRRRALLSVLCGMGVCLASVLATPLLGFGAITGFAAGLAIGTWGSRRVSPLSAEGARLRRDYQRLRNYLRDFSRLKEQPPEAVTLWERYLPLALVLGEGERALEALDVTGTHSLFTPWMRDPVQRLRLGEVPGASKGAARSPRPPA